MTETGFTIFVALLWIVFVPFVFFRLTAKHKRVKRQRTTLYVATLREHRYWHKCSGGLNVNEDGDIEHFKPGEGYDA